MTLVIILQHHNPHGMRYLGSRRLLNINRRAMEKKV